jgi:hypothetical protein
MTRGWPHAENQTRDLNARHAVERGACMEKKIMRVESGDPGCELVKERSHARIRDGNRSGLNRVE